MIYNETRYNSQWETKKLSQLGDFARGKSKHRPRNDKRLFENGKYPLVQTGEIKAADLYITAHTQEYGEFGLQQSKLWDAGTLCITIAANIAETAILSYPMCFPDSVVGFTAYSAESSALFMHYVFTYIRNSIQESTSGSIQDNINIDYLTSLDFKIPAKAYQDKIVSVLGAIDKKIALNKRINAELEAMAKTLYDYWFVQFDFPDKSGKPYRSSGGKMEWNEQLKQEIPKGWKARSLSDVITIDNTSVNPASLGSTIVEHYSIPAFDDNLYPAFDVANTIESGKYKVPSDAILVSKLNPKFKRIWDPYCITDNSICSTEFMVYQVNEVQIRPFCFAVINSDGFYSHMNAKAISSTGSRKRIQPDVSLTYQFAVPEGRTLLTKFGEIYEPVMNRQKKLHVETHELKRLRDWLLPMLMNGQATVLDA